MIINGRPLLLSAPIVDMLHTKELHKPSGTSFGLGEAGYDIRIKQSINFNPQYGAHGSVASKWYEGNREHGELSRGRFILASAIERFTMPHNMVGVVHDKSTWARRGLSVFNTVIEPGWNGYLTLELVYHGNVPLHIPAGSGIAQVLFHKTAERAYYDGKYQGQPNRPVEARSGDEPFEGDVESRSTRGTPEPGELGGPCPACGSPLFACPSGLVCERGHGF